MGLFVTYPRSLSVHSLSRPETRSRTGGESDGRHRCTHGKNVPVGAPATAKAIAATTRSVTIFFMVRAISWLRSRKRPVYRAYLGVHDTPFYTGFRGERLVEDVNSPRVNATSRDSPHISRYACVHLHVHAFGLKLARRDALKRTR